MQDNDMKPYAVDIEEVTTTNTNFRKTIWTGEQLQVTVMSIPESSDIGLERHADNDQFLRIESGQGTVMMGDSKDNLDQQWSVDGKWAIMVPAGKWHNVVNTGNEELKLYSIYAPPHHAPGTVHATAQDAKREEGDQSM